MKIYFVRHGYPDYSIDSLTERGKYEAKVTAENLNKVHFDAIYGSEMGRARATAQYLVDLQHLKPTFFRWAAEDYAGTHFIAFIGDRSNWLFWTPETREKMIELQNDERWFDDPTFKLYRPDIGITIEPEKGILEFESHLDEWLLSLGVIRDKKNKRFLKAEGKEVLENVAFFAHGAMSFLFLSAMTFLPYSYCSTHFVCLDTAGVIEYEIDLERGTCYINKYNEIFYNLDDFKKENKLEA